MDVLSDDTAAHAIDLQKVTLVHNGRQILNNLSLQIPTGVTVGLIGPNGAGKTTTFRILTGLIGSFKGDVQVLGYALPSQANSVRQRIGTVPEQDGLYDDMRVIDMLLHAARLQWPQDRHWQYARTETVLREFDVWERRKDWCGTLSTGLRRRVAIARSILHEPPLLLFDEVTNGLDIMSRNTFYEWLSKYQLSNSQNTIIFATHNSAEAARLCNFFIVLNEGQQLFCGSRAHFVGEEANADVLERRFLELLQP